MRCKKRSSSGTRKEKLGRIEEYRKNFVKQICHEFFNPLCIAQGYLHLLGDEKYGKLTPSTEKANRWNFKKSFKDRRASKRDDKREVIIEKNFPMGG